MSDPKTSPNKDIAFVDRLAVVGNASFICLAVSVVWTVLIVGRTHFSMGMLIFLAAPLLATGATVVIGGLAKDLVPKTAVSFPLNLTVPVIWCTVCFLAVHLIATQETGSTRVPEGLLPAMVWANLANLGPVMVIQIIVLTILVYVNKVAE